MKKVDKTELKDLLHVLERLQVDTLPGGNWLWEGNERAALATVMDAVRDCYLCPPIDWAKIDGA